MAEEIGALRVDVTANVAEFQADLKAAQAAVRGASTRMTSDMRSFSTQSQGFSRNFRFAAQNISYQVQDIAVQLQQGIKPLRVFTQQGTQIASAFGPWGAVIGAAAGVIGGLASALIGSNTQTEKMPALLDASGNAMERVGSKAKSLAQSLRTATDANRQLIESFAKINLQRANEQARSQVGSLLTSGKGELERQIRNETVGYPTAPQGRGTYPGAGTAPLIPGTRQYAYTKGLQARTESIKQGILSAIQAGDRDRVAQVLDASGILRSAAPGVAEAAQKLLDLADEVMLNKLTAEGNTTALDALHSSRSPASSTTSSGRSSHPSIRAPTARPVLGPQFGLNTSDLNTFGSLSGGAGNAASSVHDLHSELVGVSEDLKRSGISDAASIFSQMATGAMSAGDAIRSLAEDLGQLALRELVVIGLQRALGLFGGGSGGGGALSGSTGFTTGTGGGGMLAFANGGSFKVGGMGGTDSQLVAFRATPGERVTVDTPGNSRRGGDTYNIDARGADKAAIAHLEAQIRSLNGSVEKRAVAAVQEKGRTSAGFRHNIGGRR